MTWGRAPATVVYPDLHAPRLWYAGTANAAPPTAPHHPGELAMKRELAALLIVVAGCRSLQSRRPVACAYRNIRERCATPALFALRYRCGLQALRQRQPLRLRELYGARQDRSRPAVCRNTGALYSAVLRPLRWPHATLAPTVACGDSVERAAPRAGGGPKVNSCARPRTNSGLVRLTDHTPMTRRTQPPSPRLRCKRSGSSVPSATHV